MVVDIVQHHNALSREAISASTSHQSELKELGGVRELNLTPEVHPSSQPGPHQLASEKQPTTHGWEKRKEALHKQML